MLPLRKLLALLVAGVCLAIAVGPAETGGGRDEPRDVNEIPRAKPSEPLPWDGIFLEIKGKLTADDPKDAVRKTSHHKVYVVKFEKDKVYKIDLISTEFDAYLRLEDAGGKQLEENDDGPVLTHARIHFKPARAGEYRLVATTFKPAETGAYLLTVRPTADKVLLGEDARRVAELEKQGGQLFAAGRYAEAMKPTGQVREIRERLQGAQHWMTMNVRDNFALCEKLARMPAADQADYVSSVVLVGRARLMKQKNRNADALPLYQKALDIRRQLLGEDDRATARCYDEVALTLSAQDKSVEAEPLHRKALAIYRALGEDHPDTATSYHNLAFSLSAQGKLTEAAPSLQKALDIRRRLLGEDHPDTAASYNNVAHNLGNQGKHAYAGPLYQKALDICRRVLGEDHAQTATSYNNVAGNLNDQGRYAEAAPLFQKALDIWRRLLSEDHPDTGTGYNNVALNLNAQRKYAEAAPLFRKALAIHRRALGEDHRETARSYANVALNLTLQGQHAEAGWFLQQALDIRRRVLGEEHPRTAESYNHVAFNLNARGKFGEAGRLHQKAVETWRQLLGEDHQVTAMGYGNVAANLADQGEYGEAEKHALRAARSFEQARLEVAFSGLERTTLTNPLPLLVGLQARQGKAREAGKNLEAILARGLFDDLAARHARPLTGDERRTEEELIARVHLLDQQITALLSGTKPSDAQRQQADKLRNQRDKLQIQLGDLQTALAKKHGPVAGQVYDVERIQTQLPQDVAVLVWLDRNASPKAADPSGDRWAFILRHRGEPTWVKLRGSGDQGAWTEADEQSADRLRRLLADRPEDAKAVWQDEARALYVQRLAPVVKYLAAANDLPAVRHLIVLPSLAMRRIPVETLLAVNKDFPAVTVSYAPSGTLYAWLKEQRAKAPKEERSARLLALGDPSFAKADNKPKEVALVRGLTFQPLPGTRREVDALSKLFGESTKLLGSDATEEKLEQLALDGKLKVYRYIHLATHGMIDVQSPMRSYLALAQDKLPDPLERVLAGKSPYTGELSAGHILRTWKLDADLVVLSACQTGLGKYEGGEGYVGFSQALLLSGARSLVLSQWSVDDTATALLMTRFYENLLGKRDGLKQPLPKAKALQEAKYWLRNLTVAEAEKLIEQLPPVERGKDRERPLGGNGVVRPFEHPYYWAAFILIGDPE